MIAAAYAYMNGDGEITSEIDMLNLIDKFGAAAVLPSPTPLPILKRLQVVDAVRSAYTQRTRAELEATWMNENPEMARLLNLALREAIDLKLIKET